MAKFLAVHPLPAPIPFKDAISAGKWAKAHSTVDAYWVRSWAQLNEDGKIVKILCEWNAPNIEEVRKVLSHAPVPTEGIYPMMIVDSEGFR